MEFARDHNFICIEYETWKIRKIKMHQIFYIRKSQN